MFIISLVLIFLSSYLITSMVVHKNVKNNVGLIYYFIIAFAQIVLTFEILSLLNKIATIPFLICNGLVCIISLLLWGIKKCPFYKINMKAECKKIFRALKRDKILYLILIFLIIFLIYALIKVFYTPIFWGDAITYYYTRGITWIQNGNINHFVTTDTRETIMSVNMDFLYCWWFMFLKTERATGIFTYFSFVGLLYILYNFLGELGFCIRKRIWTIGVVACFSLFQVMAYTPCADLFVGTLLLAAIYLFLLHIKKGNMQYLYFSTLAWMLAVGSKTNAIIASLSILLIFISLLFIYKKQNKIKILGLCILFCCLNFIIFASYNHILNFINYSNPISCTENFLINKFRGGIYGYISNLIKYSFAIFDLSGFQVPESYSNVVLKAQENVLSIFGITPKDYTSKFFNPIFEYTSSMGIISSFLGIAGLCCLLPALICSWKLSFERISSVKIKVLLLLALSLIINVLIFSRVMVFTEYNMRYLVTFVVIASPILIFTYAKSNKNLYKVLVLSIMLSYLALSPIYNMYSFLSDYTNFKKNLPVMFTGHKYYKYVRRYEQDEIGIFNYFIHNQEKSKIALLQVGNFYIERLKLFGFRMEKLLPERIQEYDLSDYDYIIIKLKHSRKTLTLLNYEENEEMVRCIYWDSDKKELDKYDSKKNALTDCTISYKLFEEKGFEKVENTEFRSYVILKNKKSHP